MSHSVMCTEDDMPPGARQPTFSLISRYLDVALSIYRPTLRHRRREYRCPPECIFPETPREPHSAAAAVSADWKEPRRLSSTNLPACWRTR